MFALSLNCTLWYGGEIVFSVAFFINIIYISGYILIYLELLMGIS